MKYWSFIVFVYLVLLTSCQQPPKQQQEKKVSKQEVKEHLERANQYLVKAEDQNIRDYITRRSYQMTETGSGLFYEIYVKTEGIKAQKDKRAVLKYTIRLLSGELIYSSDKEGLKEFLIGKGGVESGLEEAILLMRIGERARFIIPSHLAFGLSGDFDRIPEKATIVYDLELLKLK